MRPELQQKIIALRDILREEYNFQKLAFELDKKDWIDIIESTLAKDYYSCDLIFGDVIEPNYTDVLLSYVDDMSERVNILFKDCIDEIFESNYFNDRHNHNEIILELTNDRDGLSTTYMISRIFSPGFSKRYRLHFCFILEARGELQKTKDFLALYEDSYFLPFFIHRNDLIDKAKIPSILSTIKDENIDDNFMAYFSSTIYDLLEIERGMKNFRFINKIVRSTKSLKLSAEIKRILDLDEFNGTIELLMHINFIEEKKTTPLEEGLLRKFMDPSVDNVNDFSDAEFEVGIQLLARGDDFKKFFPDYLTMHLLRINFHRQGRYDQKIDQVYS